MKASLAEISVVGGIIGDAEQCETAFNLLRPEMFENQWLRDVFTACVNMRQNGERVDCVSIEAKIGKQHRVALTECVKCLPTFAGYDGYCAAVLEAWRVRTLAGASLELSQYLTSKDWMDAAERILAQQRAIESGLKDATASDFWGCVMQFMDSLIRPVDAVKSGMSVFDWVTGGLQRKGFYIIAGRSGQGKTDFSTTLATNMSAKYRVTYCTMEMPKTQLMSLVASRIAQVDATKIRDKTVSPDEMERISLALSRMRQYTQLSTDDQLGITIEDVENKILKQTPDILFIDHIGLMNHGNYKNAWEGVANTSKRLKQLAMKHNIVIVGLVQETKDNGLKGSDNLTNDADGIFFMKSEPPKSFIQGDAWIDAEVQVAKNRHGGRGALKFHWRPQYHEWRQVDDRR